MSRLKCKSCGYTLRGDHKTCPRCGYVWSPSPAQIEKACRRIRRHWSKEERRRRCGQPILVIPEIGGWK